MLAVELRTAYVRSVFSDILLPAYRAQLARHVERDSRRAHMPSAASTGFRDAPRVSAHTRVVGNSLPGFNTPAALNALRRLNITSRSSSVNRSGIRSRFSSPTP